MSAIIPPHLPGLPAKVAIETIQRQIHDDPGANGDELLGLGAAVLAVRGYFRTSFGPTTGNDVGYFDDAFFLVNWKTGLVDRYNGNTDPSRLGRNTAIDKDFAILQPGVHLFHAGKHKGKAAAWRQADDETALRLRYHKYFTDYRADGSFRIWRGAFGAKPETGYFAINYHWGEYSTSSWGCLTAPGSPTSGQWLDLQRKSYKAAPLGLLPVVLVDNAVLNLA